MNRFRQCAAVIPCQNEAAAIGQLVQALKAHLDTILVVDDGSVDQTADIATEAGAGVLRLPQNLGKGAALRAGWTHLRQEGFNWALCLDGDGQHSTDDAPVFFQAGQGAQLVLGNRMGDPAGMPPLRRMVNRLMSREISKLCGVEIPDSQCGYRLLNLDCWAALASNCDRFEIESDIVVGFAALGHEIVSVPVQVIYKTERSKIHPVADTIRWFQWRRKVRLNLKMTSPALNPQNKKPGVSPGLVEA